ncbi:hypothetical protein ACVV2G_09160 [Streptomyces ziwulingensis]
MVIAALGLMVLAASSRLLGEVVGAAHPQGPVWDVGGAGPWVASYARAVAAGSWTAARACLMLAALILVLDVVSLVVDAMRRVIRRPGRPVS